MKRAAMSAFDTKPTSGLSITWVDEIGNASRDRVVGADCSPLGSAATCARPRVRTRMACPEEINADMLAFWNGKGGDTRVARQEHTDITPTICAVTLLGCVL